MQRNSHKNQQQINKIEITNDKITGRGGLAFFLRYVEQIGFYELSEKILGNIRITSKGLSLYQFIKQMLAYFIDGTYMSIKSFNDRKKDSGYTALLENTVEAMGSSHQTCLTPACRQAGKKIFPEADEQPYRECCL